MVCTRPDITFAVGTVRRYMSNPGREHWATVKWILRYLKGTSKVCLRYGFGKPMLEGFTNLKPVGSALPTNCNLNVSQCPKGEKDKAEMRKVPYPLVVSGLMYVMVYTRPDIAFAIGTLGTHIPKRYFECMP